jgi:hypothetical protein
VAEFIESKVQLDELKAQVDELRDTVRLQGGVIADLRERVMTLEFRVLAIESPRELSPPEPTTRPVPEILPQSGRRKFSSD